MYDECVRVTNATVIAAKLEYATISKFNNHVHVAVNDVRTMCEWDDDHQVVVYYTWKSNNCNNVARIAYCTFEYVIRRGKVTTRVNSWRSFRLTQRIIKKW